MKRIINLILALVFMCMTTLTASATEYITDVMLIGAYAQADYNALVAKYTSQGWKATNWDLNKGIAWGSGDAILLLYKTAESTDGFNHEYITDFYIQNRSAAKTTQTLNFMGRTYDLVPVSDDSDSHFKGQYGDLNSHTGASTDPIHLYYTKETFADNRVVTGITFNDTKSGGVGCEGNIKTGFDLNAGCSALTSQQIYMHLTTATAPVKDCYISEVKLVGAGSSDELDTYLNQYAVDGWKVINYDLNKGINWGDGEAIYLLYKTTISPDGLNHGYITDFYIQNRSTSNTTTTLNYNDRLYQIVQYVGSSHFQSQMGDLNSGTGASTDPIHLYCTTDRFLSDGRTVNGIYFNATQSGAVGKEGGSTGFDLNAGCSSLTSQQIYMHITTATTYRNSPTQSCLDLFEPQVRGFRVKGWAFNPDEPDAQLPIRVEMRTANNQVYREYHFSTDVLRTDVNDAYTLTGNHGFDKEYTIVDIPAGTYTIKVFASNLADGETQIGSTQSLTITRNKPASYLDFVEGETNNVRNIRVQGWAYDPDVPSESVPIRVVIKRTDGTVLKTVNLNADVPRPDVNSAKGISGNHGFAATIPIDGGIVTVSVYADDLTYDDEVQVGTTKTVDLTKVVTLTSSTGEVTLYDGDGITGTGGDETRIIIAAGATVTLSGVNITSPYTTGKKVYESTTVCANNTDREWSGITCLGSATIILADGTSNYVQGGGTRYSGIQPGPPGTVLTIRGNGALEACGWPHGAGIGSINDGCCGDIEIKGGNIKAYSYSYYYVLFKGNPFRAAITGAGAAIGTGTAGSCGDIVITGGTIFAETAAGSAAIGCGTGGRCGNIIFGNSGLRIEAKRSFENTEPYTVGIASNSNNITSTCGTLTIGGVKTDYITDNPWTYAPVDNNLTFTVNFDANGGSGSMNNQGFVYNVPQILNACAFTRTHYHFNGWNTKADGSGVSFTDQQEVYNVTGPSEMLMMYAQWEPDNYSITYVNAVNGTDYIVNTNPTSYTYITGTINLTAPTKFGYEFVGWTWEGQTTPTKSAAISQGSTGNKTFTAHWARATALELTQDIGGYTMVDGQIITGSGGANTHITIADGATVTLNGVDIRSIVDDTDHSWAGITCLGSATIILADGTTNYVKGAHAHKPGIFIGNGHTLTIKGNGTLNAKDGGQSGSGIGGDYNTPCGNIVIEGGTIIATGSSCAPGIGNTSKNGTGGDITIKGGTVTAVGEFYAAGIGSGQNCNCGNITITDGITSVTATKGGWDSPATIGAGKGGTSGTINISSALTSIVSGITQSLFHQLTLTDNADNTAAINGKNGRTCKTVTLSGRTLYKDGAWNTLCLPFALDLTADGCPLAGDGVTAMTLNTTTSGLSGSTLTLNFTEVSPSGEQRGVIPAGTPFIIKWDNKGTTIEEPEFTSVTISSATTNNEQAFLGGSFKGSFSPVSFTANDKTKLFLGAGNNLHWPSANMTLGAFRAYFDLGTNNASEFVLNFGDGENVTGVNEVIEVNEDNDNSWYTLSGTRLEGKPTQKGLYIHGNKKIVVK